jgi:hypothetical protein
VARFSSIAILSSFCSLPVFMCLLFSPGWNGRLARPAGPLARRKIEWDAGNTLAARQRRVVAGAGRRVADRDGRVARSTQAVPFRSTQS